MKIALYARQQNSITEEDLKHFIQQISKFPFECCIHRHLFHQVKHLLPATSTATFEAFQHTENLKQDDIELIVTLGGDGTLLDVVSKSRNIPVLGINFGRLGFLAVVGKEDLQTLFNNLLDRVFFIEERMLLHVDTSIEGTDQFNNMPYALNDCVIHATDFSSMLNIHTYLNGEYLTSFWGDGIVISSPTGSTGYSLSCNGPIVFPDIHSIIITPIAAHNLNSRPIIVSEKSVIAFTIETRSDKYTCSLDSRHYQFAKNIQIAIKKEEFNAKLIRFTEKTFLHTLKQKLYWGFDKRSEKP